MPGKSKSPTNTTRKNLQARLNAARNRRNRSVRRSPGKHTVSPLNPAYKRKTPTGN